MHLFPNINIKTIQWSNDVVCGVNVLKCINAMYNFVRGKNVKIKNVLKKYIYTHT